jgi:hypothetical protein
MTLTDTQIIEIILEEFAFDSDAPINGADLIERMT